jgi:hypothetical protein
MAWCISWPAACNKIARDAGKARTAPAAGNNHLWDGNHAAETTQLIASQQGERQSTQLVGLDVRLVYRQGLRDADALALYQQADPTALLHAVADRAMLHYFAGQQLDNLLGDALAATARQLQHRSSRR